MRYLYYCQACKKTVEKKPKEIDNCIYIPGTVWHQHKGFRYTLMQITEDEFLRNPYYVKAR